ncbi:hypothetical protein ABZ467_18680 [Streptomyces sp. NPDC005727]|uniref:hypothetical protein n=1 Tax=unclassified Streptomyces TaxID=2593676 RepID=UPI00340B7ACC
MAMAGDELRQLLAEFIRQQRRLERLTGWGEPTPDRLAAATEVLVSARLLLAEAEDVIRDGPGPADGFDAEDACTCLAILVPTLLASVGYEDPPPPTFTGILADLAEARVSLSRPGGEPAKAEALASLNEIIEVVGREAGKVAAGETPRYWRSRLQGAVRVSRALIPHVATTTAIALASTASGGPFAAALSTVGSSLAALLLPTGEKLKALFEPPKLGTSAIALHKTAAKRALKEGRRLLKQSEEPAGKADSLEWVEQAHAAVTLHLRVLGDVPGADIEDLERDADTLLQAFEHLKSVADDTPEAEPDARSLEELFASLEEETGGQPMTRQPGSRRRITRTGQPMCRNELFGESTIDANVPEPPPPDVPNAPPPGTRSPPRPQNGPGTLGV